MKNTNYIKIGILLLIVQLTSCNKTNWNESFREKDKNPFGTYILYNEAKDFLNTNDVVYLKENIYDYLYNNYSTTSKDFGNYICIKDNAYKITDSGVDNLLSFVSDGNNAFISLNTFSNYLKEQLDFTTNNLDKQVYKIADLKKRKGNFYLENEAFKNNTYAFDRNIQRNYIVKYNTNKTIVLGTTEIDGEKLPNFIKIYHGKGAIYIHTNPIVFTNYYLLKDKETYTENVFSYLNNITVLWDPMSKYSKYSNKREKDNTSVFKFFLKHKTLTWFLIVSFVGLLLFMLFNARRKQRVIPIIHPLQNTTVAFTQTISSLYLKENDHKNLVDKKIAFFLEKVRTKYLLDTSNLNASFIEKLAAKSGNKLQNIKYLINSIIALNKKVECSEENLLVLHKMIDNFFRK
ncbi:hypothetical protein MC378_04945 [Polaribacter sp. MSW13]|uniref:DUF4350 domain-containing protein n=1 Tax=Polaribacter marinus TaxID=2916838 RepID=A0A9X1VL56_9FLAO|nr:DUF4350 domain-containing protein [Polaribacter marinus]MCI2228504.1 hypothetical protein [Polaribacter marinus]